MGHREDVPETSCNHSKDVAIVRRRRRKVTRDGNVARDQQINYWESANRAGPNEWAKSCSG